MEQHFPFGMRGEELFLISELSEQEKTGKSGCVCPNCRKPLKIHMQDGVASFVHKHKACNPEEAYFAGLYLLLNAFLASGRALPLPAVIAVYDLSNAEPITMENASHRVFLHSPMTSGGEQLQVFPPSSVRFQKTRIDRTSDGRCKALIAEAGGRSLAVTIRQPAICQGTGIALYADTSAVLLDLSGTEALLLRQDKQAFFAWLTAHATERICWIYNQKIQQAYPEIVRRSKELLMRSMTSGEHGPYLRLNSPGTEFITAETLRFSGTEMERIEQIAQQSAAYGALIQQQLRTSKREQQRFAEIREAAMKDKRRAFVIKLFYDEYVDYEIFGENRVFTLEDLFAEEPLALPAEPFSYERFRQLAEEIREYKTEPARILCAKVRQMNPEEKEALLRLYSDVYDDHSFERFSYAVDFLFWKLGLEET